MKHIINCDESNFYYFKEVIYNKGNRQINKIYSV